MSNESRSPTYVSWAAMIQRCTDPNHSSFPAYGGRGIEVHKKWTGRGGFAVFLRDVGERPCGKTLDRRNNDGNYEPGNCRWATRSEQQKNKRNRGGRPSKRSDLVVAAVRAMRAAGMVFDEIGTVLGVDERTVRGWLEARS